MNSHFFPDFSFAYNQSSLDRIAKRALLALLLLVGGTFVVILGFALVLGGTIR